jgi:hypothetical protein
MVRNTLSHARRRRHPFCKNAGKLAAGDQLCPVFQNGIDGGGVACYACADPP